MIARTGVLLAPQKRLGVGYYARHGHIQEVFGASEPLTRSTLTGKNFWRRFLLVYFLLPMPKASLRTFGPYLALIAALIPLSFLARTAVKNAPHLLEDGDMRLFVVAALLFIAYVINRIAPRTAVPSFVWAIFAGMALQPLLSFFTGDIGSLKTVIEVCGALVLFAGGLEIPFASFKRWFFPIASLSLIGVLVSSVLFAFVLMLLIQALSGSVDSALLPTIVILSAALASTDPTAIIPTLKLLRFKRPALKEIAVAESALTDVSGSVITRFLLLAVIGAGGGAGILSYFTPLFQKTSYDALALQIISGILVGYAGYAVLRSFYGKDRDAQEDPAMLIAVPLFTFGLGNALGGAGFLAAFASGLFSDAAGMKKVTHFYASLLDHLVKPFIFIMLGALVPVAVLMKTAPLGILAALLFMFLVRPLVVFISLAPWLTKAKISGRDILFLSFIRETGIIAAVLIIIAAANAVIVSEFIIAVGMWVILLTLLIEPPLTPAVAKAIGVAEPGDKAVRT